MLGKDNRNNFDGDKPLGKKKIGLVALRSICSFPKIKILLWLASSVLILD